MVKSLETIQLAINLIDRIRHSYPTEESKMYLAENEKETYIFATHIAYTLMSERPDLFLPEKVYSIAAKAKAAILRNEISENELLRSSLIPDSIRKENKYIAENIAAYNHLILKESVAYHPDEKKISEWKDELFELNRRNEEFSAYLNKAFPEYNNFIMMTEPGSVPYIQQKISSDETMIDYLVSNTYHDGKRMLYTFIITRKDLKIYESDLDSSFAAMANVIRTGDKPAFSGNEKSGNFGRYTLALNYMYEKLIGPYEKYFTGEKLIIIPDEEISWLPFDAFLISKPEKKLSDYEDLDFLINRYAFSYGYSSSLVFGKSGVSQNSHKVFSFSPDYTICCDNSGTFPDLRGARKEIKSIYRYFDGSQFTGRQATKQNFRDASDNSVIFHLAMHALPDSTNSKYSFFLFGSDNKIENGDDGKLYNYEISLMRSNSPMVVLSACNSGTGELYQGEGMMSLARGFLLAGASSVIKTAWEVNDEVSARIISDFYRYLSLGKTKDEAMRQAKLNLLKNSSPSLHNPYYWAAYEVMGDNAPVAWSSRSIVMISSVLIVIVFGAFWYYFRRRRIFSDLLL
jgi:CHAT domain-containing protein